MSQFRIDLSESGFRRDHKRALRKYPSIKNDLKELFTVLESGPDGDPIPEFGNSVWKVRMAVKGHLGKSDGYRVIYHVDGTRRVMTPLFLYAKSSRVDIGKKQIERAAKALLTSLRSRHK